VASGGELSRLLRLKVNSKLSANQMTLKQRWINVDLAEKR
jgi:hypothetical protein